MKNNVKMILVILVIGTFALIGCSSESIVAEEEFPEQIRENTQQPTSTLTPTEVPTDTPTPEPTITPTLTPTEDWRSEWGDRYWTAEQILELLQSSDYVIEQFLWDPELPDEDDPYMPEYPVTFEFILSPPEGFTVDDLNELYNEYAEELSLVPADYICDRLYTWLIQGYGWPTEPSAEERFGFEFMSDQVYRSVIADPANEPYCSQFDPINRENTLQLIAEWEQENP